MKQKRIVVICPHPEGVAPGQRLKYEQYFTHFRNNGIEVDVKPFMSDRFWNIVYKKGHILEKIFWTLYGYLKRICLIPLLPFYDGVYIFLNVTPFGKPLLERMYIWMNPNIIYDIDDLVFLGNTTKVNRWVSLLKRPEKYTFLMQRAKHVIVCTPYLEAFVRKYNNNVDDISSTINTEVYLPVNTYTNEKTLTIGWSGSHSTLKYFFLLKDILIELREKHTFNILVFGVHTCEDTGLQIEVVPFSEQAEVATLQRIDIGVYPLPLDEQWVYGKSGLKALQYMALGIPTIATGIAANLRVIENRKTGMLVKTKEEWLNGLETLLTDASLRRELGLAARKKVADTFSIEANKDKYLKIVVSIVR
ncbi:glycosyltransferase family 4 protein [Cytophaga hutchinsonii]|uniref:A-glycosyltransferase-related protein, glycosyltransferase family 4 protein n=1 Tax=Cytophaga hutchinsonii (strain ATCC 33406 / DSM 1761 / CIP 103989 / NBRC 15051 / NCIMB 9469 / D465) TaxID=269798 RepID=A0A6N4SM80_CYTH3|nr:glycosyltransferase family 4 protein [Cytophaga hutchinsonii]ABG57357.1 a-glycosyltransferase-related protein, glycosyltransferase family 4 protein [Cytophaga hutchinsonii ATCC 33406]SFX47028.1 Glycosyltransferase involved in cell wall bisynthesis [Cytophaga hutchinsonii ATCC 33406]